MAKPAGLSCLYTTRAHYSTQRPPPVRNVPGTKLQVPSCAKENTERAAVELFISTPRLFPSLCLRAYWYCCVNPLNPSWLRAVRISAFCIFLVIFIAVVRVDVPLLTHYDPKDSSSSRLQWAFLPSLLWFPYFWVFWRLRDITDDKRVKNALALAVSWGSFGGQGFWCAQ